MKSIDEKSLIEAQKNGLAFDIDAALMSYINPEIDDREPDERMADELEKINMALGTFNVSEELNKTIASLNTMNKEQIEKLSVILRTLISAIERIGEIKVSMPEQTQPKWDIQVDAKRDSNGLIQFPYNISVKRI